jgi:hypothetical protein
MTRRRAGGQLPGFAAFASALLLVAAPAAGQSKVAVLLASSVASVGETNPAAMCEAAIGNAERRYGLPPHLLASIGLVETGRPDAGTGRVRPWPWSVQANNVGHYFATKAEAVKWVQDAEVQGISSIDVGCLQVNLYFHATAFDALDNAFDPTLNVDYAARFLTQLHTETNDWVQATGFYHSRTPTLAVAYQQQVQRIMGSPLPEARIMQAVVSPAARLSIAWRSTLDEPHPVHNTTAVKSWDSLLTPVSSTAKPRRKPRSLFASAETTMQVR